MTRRKFLWIVVVGAIAALGVGRAEAAPALLSMDLTGTFGPTTTLQGTALGADTPFTFHAVFDATKNQKNLQGGGFFPVTSFAITIAGHGTFAGIPNVDLNAVVLDPSYVSIPGVYVGGLIDHTATSFFLHEYSAASPPFSAPTPTPTTFQGYLGTLSGVPPYVIPLAGGAGDLAINDFGAAAPTASLVAAPEPASVALFAVAGLPLVCGTVLSRRSAM